MKFLGLIGMYVLLNSVGQLLIKTGTQEIGEWSQGWAVWWNFKLLSGIGLFGLSFLTWIYILSKHSLSYAFPLAVGLGYVAVVLLAIVVLREMPTGLQFIGMSLIGAGIILMSWQTGLN